MSGSTQARLYKPSRSPCSIASIRCSGHEHSAKWIIRHLPHRLLTLLHSEHAGSSFEHFRLRRRHAVQESSACASFILCDMIDDVGATVRSYHGRSSQRRVWWLGRSTDGRLRRSRPRALRYPRFGEPAGLAGFSTMSDLRCGDQQFSLDEQRTRLEVVNWYRSDSCPSMPWSIERRVERESTAVQYQDQTTGL